MTKWYEQDNPNPDRAAGWFLVRGLVLIVVIAAISGAIWFAKVQLSPIKGAGDVKAKNYSAENQIAAQKKFEGLYAGIKAADQRIDIMAAALDAAPGDFVARTNYTGALTFCGQLVADYNSAARETISAGWRAVDLPEQIDPTNPETDCKGTAK